MVCHKVCALASDQGWLRHWSREHFGVMGTLHVQTTLSVKANGATRAHEKVSPVHLVVSCQHYLL